MSENPSKKRNVFANTRITPPAVPAASASMTTSVSDAEVALHTLLYQLQEEVDEMRAAAVRQQEQHQQHTLSSSREGSIEALTSKLRDAQLEVEALHAELDETKRHAKERERDLEQRLKRVDAAVRSEASRKERSTTDELQTAISELKAMHAQKESRSKAEIDTLRNALQAERLKRQDLEKSVHQLQQERSIAIGGGATVKTPIAQRRATSTTTQQARGGRRDSPSSALQQQQHQSGGWGPPTRLDNGTRRLVHTTDVSRVRLEFPNGDWKEVNTNASSCSAVVYWYEQTQTLVSTGQDGTKRIEFRALGQVEVVRPDGTREVTKDGETVVIPPPTAGGGKC